MKNPKNPKNRLSCLFHKSKIREFTVIDMRGRFIRMMLQKITLV